MLLQKGCTTFMYTLITVIMVRTFKGNFVDFDPVLNSHALLANELNTAIVCSFQCLT